MRNDGERKRTLMCGDCIYENTREKARLCNVWYRCQCVVDGSIGVGDRIAPERYGGCGVGRLSQEPKEGAASSGCVVV